MGLQQLPCIDLKDMSEAEAAAFMIAYQETAKSAEYDLDDLSALISDVILPEERECTFIDDQLLDVLQLGEPAAATSDLEEVMPEPPLEPVSRRDDLFVMGGHRLLCADATDLTSYILLLGEEKARAVLTDIPFNVKIAGNVSGLGKKKHGEFVEWSGEKTGEEFLAFNLTLFTCWAEVSLPGSFIATFIDFRSVGTIIQAGKSAGLHLINLAVWDKGGGGGMGAYLRSAHELLPIFCNGDQLACNNVMLGKNGRNRTNIWRYPGANRPGSSAAAALKDHPTPKNVEMIEDAILDVTARDDIVLDPFLGSGTTMVAAEKTRRRCFAMELDPKFVDVSIARWEALTGQDAIHEASGMTFAQLRNSRQTDAIANH